MKRKEMRPEATPLSLFFFSHLAGTGNETAAPTVTNPSSSSLSPPAAEGAETAVAVVGAAPIPPGTGAKAVDAALWSRFTPAAYKAQAAQIVAQEHEHTLALEFELAAAWEKVEAVMARNKARRALLADGALSEGVQPVREMLFWTAEEVAERFQLNATVDAEAVEAVEAVEYADPAARITLDFSVLTAPPVETKMAGSAEREEDDEDAEIVDGNDEAEAKEGEGQLRGREARDLLDPCRHPHCLRRLFASTLRRKAELPKNAALLLRDLQQVQSGELPALEAALAEVRGMFRVPLYLPFRLIRDVLVRELCRPTGIAGLEEAGVSRLRLAESLVRELDDYVARTAADQAASELTPLEEKVAASERMWALLFRELDEHKTLHATGLCDYEGVTHTAESTYAALVSSLNRCDTRSRANMAQLLNDTEFCAEAVRRSMVRTMQLVTDMDTGYTDNAARLRAAIDRKAHAIARSEATQEKLARRVREAVKELYVEQAHYEETTQELLRDRLSLAQLETSYEQLRQSFQARHVHAQSMEQRTSSLRELLSNAEGARQRMLAACRQHVERVHHDDFYRRCRVMSKVVANAQAWSRCVQDVGTLYEQRFATLDGKARATWQLNYLVAGERDWAAGNLLDVRPEVAEHRASWDALQPLLAPLDIDVSSTQQQRGGVGAEALNARRELMAMVDGPHAVQRKVTTLAQHRARKAKAATATGAKTHAAATTTNTTMDADSCPAADVVPAPLATM